jgi:predicted nucleotidyltransferase
MSELAASLPLQAIRDLCQRWKIARLEVFGSILRDDFGPASDVDFLVTFEPDARWGLEIVDMEKELASIVGRRVDLVSRRAVEGSDNWVRRKSILESARTIHVAA